MKSKVSISFVLLFLGTVSCSDDEVESQSATLSVPESCMELPEEKEDCRIELTESGRRQGIFFRTQREIDLVCSSTCTSIDAIRVSWETDTKALKKLAPRFTKVEGISSEGPHLSDFSAFTRLKRLNFIRLEGTSSPRSFKGLEQLESIGGITLDKASGIEDFSELSSASFESSEYGSGLMVRDCPDIKSLDGIESLSDLRNLEIMDNPQLRNIQGLSGLRKVRKVLNVRENSRLESIDPLFGLAQGQIGTRLAINDNPKVPACRVEELIEALGGKDAFRDGTYTQGNDEDAECM